MKPGRLVWFGAGAAAGLYLVDKRRRNLATEPPALRGHRGRSLEPVLVELAGGECVPVIDTGEGPAGPRYPMFSRSDGPTALRADLVNDA